MLKKAWDKVAGFLPKGVRTYLEGDRYIKLDGTPYHTKGVAAIMHRPEVKVGLACTFYSVANQLLYQGNWNMGTAEVQSTAISGLVGTAFATGIYRGINFPLKVASISKRDKAIDTEGRDLSRSALSIADYNGLKRMKLSDLLVGSFMVTFSLGHAVAEVMYPSAEATSAPQLLDPYLIALTATFMLSAIRAHKLVEGEYCFCDKPPAKHQESKQVREVRGGAGAHQYAPIPAPVRR